MVLTGPLKKQGPIKLRAVITTHNITYGKLCFSSTMTHRFSLAQNTTCLSQYCDQLYTHWWIEPPSGMQYLGMRSKVHSTCHSINSCQCLTV